MYTSTPGLKQRPWKSASGTARPLTQTRSLPPRVEASVTSRTDYGSTTACPHPGTTAILSATEHRIKPKAVVAVVIVAPFLDDELEGLRTAQRDIARFLRGPAHDT